MDLATLIGIVGAFGIVTTAIFLGGSFGQFIDVPSVLIVVGGGLAATLIRFQLTDIATAFVTGFKVALAGKNASPRDLITEISNLGEIVRKSGPLGLENVDVSDPVLAKGVQYIADGYELEFIKESMERERDLQLVPGGLLRGGREPDLPAMPRGDRSWQSGPGGVVLRLGLVQRGRPRLQALP